MWKERFFSAALAVAVTAACTAAITLPFRADASGTQSDAAQMDTAQANAAWESFYEALNVDPTETIASVDGNEAAAELFTFWLGNECTMLEQYYGIEVSSLWDKEMDEGQTLRDYIREDTLMAIKQQLVLENLCARYGVTLSEADEAELAEQRRNNVEQSGGEAGYRAELASLGIGAEAYDRLSRTDYLYRAIYRYFSTPGSELYVDDAALADYAAEQGYITADHILIKNSDETGALLDDDALAERRRLAEDLLTRLRAESDPAELFQELADTYSEDSGRAANPTGYTFPHGKMVESFDAAARALGENELSDVVESQYGYHIILRKPLDTAAAANAVREAYFSSLFRAELDGSELETTDALDRLDPVALYDALFPAHTAPEDGAAQP